MVPFESDLGQGVDWIKKTGAGDGIRTRNPQLGKLMRYRCATPAREGEKKIVKDLIRVNRASVRCRN